jgi:MFS family permease
VLNVATSGPGALLQHVGKVLAGMLASSEVQRNLPTLAAGPDATGKWTGLQNGFANLAGVVAPAITGFLVDRTGNFLAPLAIAAAVLVAGGLSWVFAVGRVEQVRWELESAEAAVAAACF